MSQNTAYLITTYKDKSGCENQINVIRNHYKYLNDLPIIIVSTSEVDINLVELYDKYEDVYIINYPSAPGNPKSSFKSRPQPDGSEYRSWRHEFISPRILYSINLGAKFAYRNLGLHKLIHTHSDGYWLPEVGEKSLLEDLDRINNLMAIVDTSHGEEEENVTWKILPQMCSWHPESSIFNLDRCYDTGFIFDFHKIFDEYSGFKAHNYASTECLLAQFCIWSLTRKNILKFDDELPKDYFENVYFRMCRLYHGIYPNGYFNSNINGEQPDAPNDRSNDH
jgi:hypothetical protein